MAKTHTASLTLRCWKEHTCVSCGAVYDYQMVRKVSGTGSTAVAAQVNLDKTIQKTLVTDTDLHPCPTCGLYQPDMIGHRRASVAIKVFWVTLALFIVALIIHVCNGMQYNVVAWIIATICAGAAVVLWLVDLRNLNSNIEANRQLAKQRMEGKLLRQTTPGQFNARPNEFASPGRSQFHLIALLLLLISGGMALSPEIVRTVRGWALNEKCYPPVVGPNDQTKIYMPDSITSIKGYWRGRPSAAFHEPGAPSTDKGIAISASTNQNDWGSTIYAKSSEKNSTSHPWVNLQLPTNDSLAGKQMDCDLFLDLDYPEADGSSKFRQAHTQMRFDLPIHLAPAGAGARYSSLWWQGNLAAIATVLISSLLLRNVARGIARQAKPTRVAPVEAVA